MQGRLVLRQKRKDEAGEGGASAQAVQLQIPAAGSGGKEDAAGHAPEAAALPATTRVPAAATAPKAPSKQELKLAAVMREPAFRAPSVAAKSPAVKSEAGTAHQARKNDATPVSPRETPAPGRAPATAPAEAGPAIKGTTVPGTVRAAEPGPARQPENAAVPAQPPAAGSSIDFDPGEAAYPRLKLQQRCDPRKAHGRRSRRGPGRRAVRCASNHQKLPQAWTRPRQRQSLQHRLPPRSFHQNLQQCLRPSRRHHCLSFLLGAPRASLRSSGD